MNYCFKNYHFRAQKALSSRLCQNLFTLPETEENCIMLEELKRDQHAFVSF